MGLHGPGIIDASAPGQMSTPVPLAFMLAGHAPRTIDGPAAGLRLANANERISTPRIAMDAPSLHLGGEWPQRAPLRTRQVGVHAAAAARPARPARAIGAFWQGRVRVKVAPLAARKVFAVSGEVGVLRGGGAASTGERGYD